MVIAGWVLLGIGAYGLLGAFFAVWFVVAGVGKISPASRGTGWGFRLLIAPGSAVLWPVLLWELVMSGGRGGLVVGRALTDDDLETAMDDVATVDAFDDSDYVDPDAETTA